MPACGEQGRKATCTWDLYVTVLKIIVYPKELEFIQVLFIDIYHIN